MAGIYLHIPFCRKACHYCNFHFSTSTSAMPEFIQALLLEIELRKQYLGQPVSTIYFGGGTPSLLNAQDLSRILTALEQHYTMEQPVEITLEANPDDITLEKLLSWKQLGINRLSIGVQSFFDQDLAWMNRAHNASEALNALSLARQQGFNITIDLIYGTPTLTDEQWQTNVQTAISMGIPHISCYALTVEKGTALDKMIARQKVPGVDTDKQARHFELLVHWMTAAGYNHYEISNFSLPAFESKHNSSYWQSKPYIGFGPSAHSFNGFSRQWNIANNALYIRSISKGEIPAEVELLSEADQLNEYVMTSLRTSGGINLQTVDEKWGANQAHRIVSGARKYLEGEHAEISNFHLKLTNKGKLLADGIAADLFV
ncbi:radical SAM family heme chaperone HemW [Segetibacter sp. 3557_3]|uniref:radical SAM family heme chaperone HemW n=1 Tax=Segetibacter sp. 3557_3 TaxID=2547429 RepID=UPI001058C542|nr:radical SAM family heme chaperone HemW [Segetibacter sp. 3557_3]TDH19796.1 radical SAM family heme chaperone HemW [Segetibacter sp. 3557_3]